MYYYANILTAPLLSSLSVIVIYVGLPFKPKFREDAAVDAKYVFGVSSPLKFPIA